MNTGTPPTTRRAEDAASRAESAAEMARREGRKSRGIAEPMPGVPDKPVSLPGKMWSERQREAIGEFLEFLPIIEIVAALPPVPTVAERAAMPEEQVAALMDFRLTALIAAKKIVIERVRKET